jgi:hypothetical protein
MQAWLVLSVMHATGRPIDQRIDLEAVMSAVFYRLSLMHRRLDQEIRREAKRLAPDGFRLLRLKKLKLAVKDRLNSLWHREMAVAY